MTVILHEPVSQKPGLVVYTVFIDYNYVQQKAP